jgi:hypothetical protein
MPQEQASLRRNRSVFAARSYYLILAHHSAQHPAATGSSWRSASVRRSHRNSYYASKSCTYTDASGHPVPAPRPFRPVRVERLEPDYRNLQPSTSMAGPSSSPENQDYVPDADLQHQNNQNPRHLTPRKRFKDERGRTLLTDSASAPNPRPLMNGPSLDRSAPLELDHSLTRELTNRMSN